MENQRTVAKTSTESAREKEIADQGRQGSGASADRALEMLHQALQRVMLGPGWTEVFNWSPEMDGSWKIQQ